jgi:hypothetical protein
MFLILNYLQQKENYKEAPPDFPKGEEKKNLKPWLSGKIPLRGFRGLLILWKQ